MTAELRRITDGERVWLETVGQLLGWTEKHFLTTKYFIPKGMTIKELEQIRALHIGRIREGLLDFPCVKQQTDIYAEVVTFRASRFIDKHRNVVDLTPEDRQKYDDIMELATAVAFADVSGILSRNEIQDLIDGKIVKRGILGRDIS